ncbi:glycosyltransferase [Gracilimonas tropica]|uniref:glycosyltransferase n=1 Tax=Gracilimonas tropica TaxID=454600 RepID=UPI0014614EAB|nr:glycosyltransferase [Gracilimonas tropica]
MKTIQPDVIFAANASTEIAFLDDIKIPIIYLSGGTVTLLEDYYESFSNVLLFSIKNANCIEQAAIEKSSALIYPTFWAANSAKKDYGAKKGKVHVIPYGANVDFEISEPKRLDSKEIRLLLVGIRWEGKGVPIAIEAVRELRKRGYNATIDICGCQPPEPVQEDGIHIHGFLDKRKPEEAQKLKWLYSKASFFILPTRYENFGVSFVEAFAAGLPCLGTNTGGVSTIIEQGKNGYLFELSDSGENYADRIERIIHDPGHYQELSLNARQSYEEKFNWQVWGNEIKKVVQEVAGK